MEIGTFDVLCSFTQKIMRRIVWIIVVLSVASCGLEQVDVLPHSNIGGIWRGTSYGKYMSGCCYAAGIDYPESYDWRADADKGRVSPSIVLFADGIPVLKVPSGDRYEVSADHLRHRILHGCLYTDYTDGRTTVIKKDGEEILRYEGAEEVVSMLVTDQYVHTLSIPCDSTGFTYRVNGTVVLKREAGTIEEELTVIDGEVCFCFSREQVFLAGTDMRYYIVTNGKVSMMEFDEDFEELIDVGLYDGGICVLAWVTDSNYPVLMKDGMRTPIAYFSRSDIISCGFMPAGQLCVRMRYKNPDSDMISDMLWYGDQELDRFGKGVIFSDVSITGDTCGAIANPSGKRPGVVYIGMEEYEVPDDLYVYGEGCTVFIEGTFYVGLTSRSGQTAAIWRDNELKTLDLNGPVTCLQ